jgi:hypothetical protein
MTVTRMNLATLLQSSGRRDVIPRCKLMLMDGRTNSNSIFRSSKSAYNSKNSWIGWMMLERFSISFIKKKKKKKKSNAYPLKSLLGAL